MIKNSVSKTKITLYTPQYNYSGTILYSGLVNGVYTHILSLDALTRYEQKMYLLDKYELTNHNFTY